MRSRKLTLKRVVLQELTTDQLQDIVGGATQVSCLTYISCYAQDCRPTQDAC